MAGRIDMTQGPLLGVLLRVGAPITAAKLAQSVHQLVNAWWVGRLGAGAIAAVAASGPLFQLLLSLGSGLSTAGAVLVAQNIGAGKGETAAPGTRRGLSAPRGSRDGWRSSALRRWACC